MSVKNVVAKNQRGMIVANERLTDQKGLRQSVG